MKQLFCFLILFGLAQAVLSEKCNFDESQKTVSCSACAAGGTVNTVETMPRVNRNFKPVKSDLGYYTLYSCSDTGSCSFTSASADSFTKGASNDKDIVNYIESILIYVAFFIALAVLCIIVGLLIGICRYCICCWPCCQCQSCCRCWRCCRAGLCCARQPTYWCWCCGFVKNLVTSKFEYRPCERWLVRAWMWAFFASIVVFVMLGWQKGHTVLPQAATDIVTTGPSGFAKVIHDTNKPVGAFMMNTFSGTLTNSLKEFNKTFTDAVDLGDMVVKLQCIDDRLSNLPTLNVMTNWMNTTEPALRSLNGNLTVLTFDVGNITVFRNSTRDNINFISLNVTLLTTNNAAATAASTTLSSQLATADTFRSNVTSSTAGVPALTTDFNTLANVPSSSDITNAVDGNTASLKMVTSATPMISADRQTLITRLTALNTAYAALPDYVATANRLDAVASWISAAQTNSYFYRSVQAIDDAQTKLGAVNTTISTLNTLLNRTLTAAMNPPFSRMRPTLINVNISLWTIPDTSVITIELDKITMLSAVLPCLTAVSGYLGKINSTLMSLPDEVKSIDTVYSSTNQTLNSTVTTVNSLDSKLADLNTNRRKFNVSLYLTQITTSENSLNSSLASLKNDPMLNQLNNVVRDLNIDFSARSGLSTLNTTVDGITITSTFITALRTYGTVINSIKSALPGILADVTKYDKGYCSASPTTVCASNSDCSSGTCNSIGTKRCNSNPATNCPNGDADCPAGDRCLIDTTRMYSASGISAKLTSSATVPTVSSVQTSLTTLQTQVSAANVAPLRTAVNTAVSTIGSVSATSFNSAITSANNALDAYDPNKTTQDINDTKNSLNAVNFTSSRTQIDGLSESYTTINSNLKQVRDAKSLMVAFNELSKTRLQIYLNRISRPALQVHQDRQALGQMLNATLSMFDDMTGYIKSQSPLFNSSTTFSTDMASTVKRMDAWSKPDDFEFGAVHYFYNLFSEGSVMDPKLYAGKLGRVDKYADGSSYPSGKSCYTDDCLANTVKYIDSSPLSQTVGLPVPMTREQIMLIPYALPALIAIMGLTASLMFCSHKCASWLASFTACCIFMVMPIIFLLSALFFPLSLVLADTCQGFAGIGMQYVTARGDKMCSDLGGSGTLAACKLNLQNSTLVLDIGNTYVSVMAVCDPTRDPIKKSLQDYRRSVNGLPTQQVDTMLSDIDKGSSAIKFRDPLKNVFRRAASSSGNDMATLIGDLSDSSINCQAFNDAWTTAKSAFCCKASESIYWIINSWVLIGFAMLLCGCGAALCGRKRFANTIWGNDFDDYTSGAMAIHANTQASRRVAPEPKADPEGPNTTEMARLAPQQQQQQIAIAQPMVQPGYMIVSAPIVMQPQGAQVYVQQR